MLLQIIYILIGSGLGIVAAQRSEDRGDSWPVTALSAGLSFVLWPLLAGMYLGYAFIELYDRERERKRSQMIEENSKQRKGSSFTIKS